MVTNWTWDFDDGTTLVNQTQSWTNHTFNSPGKYNITMIAMNRTLGISNQSTQLVNITGLFANFTLGPTNQNDRNVELRVFLISLTCLQEPISIPGMCGNLNLVNSPLIKV